MVCRFYVQNIYFGLRWVEFLSPPLNITFLNRHGDSNILIRDQFLMINMNLICIIEAFNIEIKSFKCCLDEFALMFSILFLGEAKFWIRRFRDAWESCTHKKAVALAIFTMVWNLSSMVARIWAGQYFHFLISSSKLIFISNIKMSKQKEKRHCVL